MYCRSVSRTLTFTQTSVKALKLPCHRDCMDMHTGILISSGKLISMHDLSTGNSENEAPGAAIRMIYCI